MTEDNDYRDCVILVKIFEEGELLDASYFQRATRSSSLFEFINRDDVFLENKNVSISWKSSFKPLEHFFRTDEEEVELNIIPCSELDIKKEKNESLSDDIIVISDSPENSCQPKTLDVASTLFSKREIKISSSSGSSSDDELPSIIFHSKKWKQDSKSYHASSPVTLPNSMKRQRVSSSSSSDDVIFMQENNIVVTENLPWDIDGDCSYRLQYDKTFGERMKSSKDGRNWQRYNKCYTKEFSTRKGLRLKSNCKGAYHCTSDNCPFRMFYGRSNTSHILKAGNDYICEECHNTMAFISCPATKIWEFEKKSDFVIVHHKGEHTCFASKKPELPENEIKQVIEDNQSLKPCEVSSKILMKTVAKSSTREEVENIAFNLSDERQVRNIKQKLLCNEPLAVKLADLQDKCLNQYNDPYLLYEYQVKEEKDGIWVITHSTIKQNTIVKTVTKTKEPDMYPTYIVKSSIEKLNTMQKMMDIDHFLSDEFAFMDFKVNRVNVKGNNLKTFGISTYHTILKKVPWLVRIDCEKEDSKTVTMALKIVDSMMQCATDGRIKLFKPTAGWMLDEGGGLHSALSSKFGEAYCEQNVVTCRLHLAQCSARHAQTAFAGDDDKGSKMNEFNAHVKKLIHSPTVNMYNDEYEKLDKFITSVNKPHLRKWLTWWDSRRTHVMEAYRPRPAPNTNLAEASHASMELCGGSNLNIVQAAIFDISEAFKYEKMLEGYCLGYVRSGVGPSKAMADKRKTKLVESNINCLLNELDDQFNGGTALSKPSNSTFEACEQSSHRADKGVVKDKRPEGRHRANASADFKISLQKAKEMKDYKIIDIEQHSPSQCTVVLKKSSETFYSIKFDKNTTCTCEYAVEQATVKHSKVPCKHRLFILLSAGLDESDVTMLQFSYTSGETRKIVTAIRAYKQKISNDCEGTMKGKSAINLKKSSSVYTVSDDFEITFLHGLISKCYGCENKFSHERQAPYDLIIRHLEVRPAYERKTKEWFLPSGNKKANAYYHMDTRCVQKIHSNFDKSQVKIPFEVQALLSEGHKEVLKKAGFYN